MTAPKLRLSGFKEPWNSGVVSRLLVERKELAPQSKQYPLMAFVAYKGVASKGDRYDRSSLVKDVAGKLYKRTEKGDFIYSSNNLETGSIGLNKYGKACISPVYGIFCPTCDSDSEYIGVALCRKKFIQEMVKWRQGVVYGQWRIHEDDFLGIPVPFPDGEEQRAMGCYFASLDRLIVAEVLRLESLRKLKVACMAKMFAGVGETCPKMRLKGYSGDWIEKRLCDLVNRVDRKNVNMEASIPLTISAQDGLIAQEQFFDKRIASKNLCGYYLIRKGEFAYNRSSSQGYPFGSVKRLEKYDNGALSALYTVFSLHDMISSDFMKAYFDTDKWHGEVRFRACEGARNHGLLNISADDFFQLELRIPPTIEEQNAIGEFMTNLDISIRLQGDRVEKMRHLKSACMERMFV